MRTSSEAREVAVVLLPGVVLLDLAAPTAILSVAGYRVRVVSGTGRRGVEAADGVGLRADAGLERLTGADTVVVLGTWPALPDPPARLLRALRAAHADGTRMLSICTGAFVLAAAGLLDGRPATTHWAACDELARRHPRIDLQPDVLYVDDGDVLTSAGVAAGLDLCLHLVRRDLGAAAAQEAARWTVISPHREGGQRQYARAAVTEPARGAAPGDPVMASCAWVLENLGRPLSVAELARRAHMSERSYARHFRARTGTTPARWIAERRIEKAQRLLETTALPVERVAERCGFRDSGALREHFRLRLGTAPTRYRHAFAVPPGMEGENPFEGQ